MYAQVQSLCYVKKKQLWNYSSGFRVFPTAATQTSQSDVLILCSMSINVQYESCWDFNLAYCASSGKLNAFAMFVYDIKHKSSRGGALGEDWGGTVPALLYEVIFYIVQKRWEKFGVWGYDVASISFALPSIFQKRMSVFRFFSYNEVSYNNCLTLCLIEIHILRF